MTSERAIRCMSLSYRYSGGGGVTGVSFDAKPGEIVALIGPSGSGKSTILRLISGLLTPQDGEIHIGAASEERKIGYVFQKPVFIPNRTVLENIAFPLVCGRKQWWRLINWKIDEKERRAALEAGEKLGVAHLLNRFPSTLSGGEAQRVAIARALIEPVKVLLLDEPLGSLDTVSRDMLREVIRKIARSPDSPPIVYVTHDRDDVTSLADRVVVLSGGEIRQIGNLTEVATTPATLFAAHFTSLHGLNVVPGYLWAGDDDDFHLEMFGQSISLPRTSKLNCINREPVLVAFDTQAAKLGKPNCQFQGTVIRSINTRSNSFIELKVNDHIIRLKDCEGFISRINQTLFFDIRADEVSIYATSGDQRLF